MKTANELKKIADDRNMVSVESHMEILINSMIYEAKKGKYEYTTINPLGDMTIKILEEYGFKVELINTVGNGYTSKITWE